MLIVALDDLVVPVPVLVDTDAVALPVPVVAVRDVVTVGRDAVLPAELLLLTALVLAVLTADVADDWRTDDAEDVLLVAEDTRCADEALVPEELAAKEEPALTDVPLSNTRPAVAFPNPVLARDP